MMTLDPLKSAISIGNVDDTSLALPSANQYRSGQQRVLDQVHTLQRTKTKQSFRGGSGQLSPTSTAYDIVFADSYKSLPSTLNGNVYNGNVYNGHGMSNTLRMDRSLHRRVNGSTMKRTTMMSNHHHDKGFVTGFSTLSNGIKNTSRSEPDMGYFPGQNHAMSIHRLKSNRSATLLRDMGTSQPLLGGQYLAQPLPKNPLVTNDHSHRSTYFTTNQYNMHKSPSNPTLDHVHKVRGEAGMRNGVNDMTMKDAVEYLFSDDEAYQHCGASFIQHSTFVDDKAKQEVQRLNGIPPLVSLLNRSSGPVQQTASAALRNLSFKNNNNKEEVNRVGGIKEATALLERTDSTETQKQLTGLLWNLSSVDSLKPDLVRTALPVLMQRVILPYTTGPDRAVNDNLDPEVFYNATGCLRNLSSAKQSNRQAMRKHRGLVDSLVSYMHECVEADKPDDKSLENCVCILHNLTFQLEAEAPVLFSKMTAIAKSAERPSSQGDTGPINCFSQQGDKTEERQFDYPVSEDPNTNGQGWLVHSKTMQGYLSLMGTSQRDDTLEACVGALQNLTSSQGIVSNVLSQTIVQKLNGLPSITPLLSSSSPNLQKNAMALVNNLTKNSRLQPAIARKALPGVMDILRMANQQDNESDDTLAMACQTASSLLIKEPELGKRLLSGNVINSLAGLSKNSYLPKSSKAAGLLLYNLWAHKDIQSFLKGQGMNKTSFVNDVTSAAFRSMQIVD